MNNGIKSAFLVSVFMMSGMGIAAQEISLKSEDGAINLEGELTGFIDNMYIINTFMGELRISGDEVDCYGKSCPVTGSSEITVADEKFEDELIAPKNTGTTPKVVEAKPIVVAALVEKKSAVPMPEGKIMLRSRSGSVELIGTFVKFEDNLFHMDTVLGSIQIPATDMDCFGELCP